MRLALFFALIFCTLALTPQHNFAQDGSTPEDDPNIVIHVVQRGENLFRIALAYDLTTEQVAAANGITNPGSILVGQRLIIPVGGNVPFVEESLTPSTHVVQPGENLRAIATLYGTTVDDLAALNGLANPNRLAVGQELQLTNDPETLVEPLAVTSALQVIHTVQPGETLFSIAQAYGASQEAIQEANGIIDPTRIFSGQSLIISPEAMIPSAVELPPSIISLQINPLVFTEGQTGAISLTTAVPLMVEGTLLGQPLRFASDDNQTIHQAIFGIPIYTAAGIYALSITLTDGAEAVEAISLDIQILSGSYGSQNLTIPADRVELLAPAVEQNELGILTSITSRFNPERYFDGAMSLPAAAAMNSPFGTRRGYNGGAIDRFHSGADFAGAPGSPVLAAAPGQVVLADALNIRGISVIIDHGWGVYTNYSHLSERFVEIGDVVGTGQMIGLIGNTGRATGAHLHWELWLHGNPVDPMQWVQQSFP